MHAKTSARMASGFTRVASTAVASTTSTPVGAPQYTQKFHSGRSSAEQLVQVAMYRMVARGDAPSLEACRPLTAPS